MDQVLVILEQNQIQILEEDTSSDEEAPEENKKPEETDRKRLVYSDKDSSIDDPIRLYLREIGKENLLTAEQEVGFPRKWKMERTSSRM
jgi:RNA polymerase primary sigma factor